MEARFDAVNAANSDIEIEPAIDTDAPADPDAPRKSPVVIVDAPLM